MLLFLLVLASCSTENSLNNQDLLEQEKIETPTKKVSRPGTIWKLSGHIERPVFEEKKRTRYFTEHEGQSYVKIYDYLDYKSDPCELTDVVFKKRERISLKKYIEQEKGENFPFFLQESSFEWFFEGEDLILAFSSPVTLKLENNPLERRSLKVPGPIAHTVPCHLHLIGSHYLENFLTVDTHFPYLDFNQDTSRPPTPFFSQSPWIGTKYAPWPLENLDSQKDLKEVFFLTLHPL